MRAVRLPSLVILVFLGAGVLWASARTPPGPKTHTVTIEGMRFEPAALNVSPGDTVVWVNKDLVPHTATSEAGGFDSKTLDPDESWRHTFDTTGSFAYICTFHPTMTGTVRVKEEG